MSKLGRKRSEKKTQLVRFGVREVETLGLSQGFWGDLYHRSMNVSWPVFFGSAAALFVALNAVFGFLYSLGHEPIANAAQNGASPISTSQSRHWRRLAMATCIRRLITDI